MAIKARIDEVHSITLECDMDPTDKLTISGSTNDEKIAFSMMSGGTVFISKRDAAALAENLSDMAMAEAVS